jgi:opacity protein-like surface antigen
MRQWLTVLSWAFAACALLVLSGGTAQAEEEEEREYGRQGYYLGLTGVFAVENFSCEDWFDLDGAACGDVDRFSGGLAGVAGIRANEMVAIEFEMEWIKGFDVEGPTDEVYTMTWMLNGKLHLMTGRIQPFLMYGLGALRAAGNGESATDFAMRGGGGVDFWIDENIAVGAETEYVFPISNAKGFDYISVGLALKYRF